MLLVRLVRLVEPRTVRWSGLCELCPAYCNVSSISSVSSVASLFVEGFACEWGIRGEGLRDWARGIFFHAMKGQTNDKDHGRGSACAGPKMPLQTPSAFAVDRQDLEYWRRRSACNKDDLFASDAMLKQYNHESELRRLPYLLPRSKNSVQEIYHSSRQVTSGGLQQ